MAQREPSTPPIKISDLLAEGVLQVGMAGNFPFILTKKRLVLVRRTKETINELRDKEYLAKRWQELRDLDHSTHDIADMYGVSVGMVIELTNDETWARSYRDPRAMAKREGRTWQSGGLRKGQKLAERIGSRLKLARDKKKRRQVRQARSERLRRAERTGRRARGEQIPLMAATP